MSQAVSADAVVIGAGFGGMGAALTLAEAGQRVIVCEALRYPGGCASTFTKRGSRFEAGATLFSGFGQGQLMRQWIDRYDLDVRIQLLDPVIELRAPGLCVAIPARREVWIEEMCERPGAPREALRRFFEFQQTVAQVLWECFDDPELLPPLSASALGRHVRRSPRYLPVLGVVGKSLMQVLQRFGVAEFEPLRQVVDALCQITVQCPASEAEAPFALAAIDYTFRGTAHVHGGIGQLASGLVQAISKAGGEVRLGERVRGLRRVGELWELSTRSGRIQAPTVVANTLPHGLRTLLDAQPGANPSLDASADRVETSWGAAMLYLEVDADAPMSPRAHHLQLVDDPTAPLMHGNHLFCSVSGVDEDRTVAGHRTVTISTHMDMKALYGLDDAAQGEHVAMIQDRMRETLARRAPELHGGIVSSMTGSPRTFERFTRRYRGYVGGVPRTTGLHNYARLKPSPVRPGLYLVGDSVFPGQSTLAAALGGQRTARRILG